MPQTLFRNVFATLSRFNHVLYFFLMYIYIIYILCMYIIIYIIQDHAWKGEN